MFYLLKVSQKIYFSFFIVLIKISNFLFINLFKTHVLLVVFSLTYDYLFYQLVFFIIQFELNNCSYYFFLKFIFLSIIQIQSTLFQIEHYFQLYFYDFTVIKIKFKQISYNLLAIIFLICFYEVRSYQLMSYAYFKLIGRPIEEYFQHLMVISLIFFVLNFSYFTNWN